MEFSLLGAVAVAVVAVRIVLRLEAGRGNAADCTGDLWDGLLTAGIVGLAVGRVAAMLLDGTNPVTHLGDLVIVRGGVDTAAASLSAVAVLGWRLRSDLWWMLDAAAPAAVAGLAGWHAGCLVRESACLGTPSSLPWAIGQAGSSVTRHPVEIYAALLLGLAAAALALWKRYRRPRPGVLAGAAIAVAGLARLVTEPMRPSLGSTPAWLYGAAAIVGLGVTALRAASTPASR
ncbi:MAG TPA: prolipoprotein diacylglyceryl transferase family protein [Acidimicrobiia bacterium]|nr:prolipoprotein diacylglyceryl transferase family protein [Acidimicrobiia bacterium]